MLMRWLEGLPQTVTSEPPEACPSMALDARTSMKDPPKASTVRL
jgi:hypothetical protein